MTVKRAGGPRTIVTVLEDLRIARGLGTTAAAAAAGINAHTLTDMERGRIQSPHARTIMKLAAFYEVEPGWLLQEYRQAVNELRAAA